MGSVQTGFCGIFGEQVDAIDYYTSRIEKLTEEVSSLSHLYAGSKFDVSNVVE